MLLIALFAAIMGAGAWNAITRGGEKEGICKYGYKEEDNEQ